MPVLVERPEIASFISSWRGKPGEQVVEELASYSLETKRIPDPYYFTFTATGELFSSSAHCRIKDSVCRTNHLGQLEYQAVYSIEQWAASNSEGSVVWVSPPYQDIYPTSKIVISQIEHQDGVKRLFNRAIILDFDEKKCLEFAQNLAKFSTNSPLLSHLDQVRATPIILNTHGNSWIYILEELIDDPALWESVRNGKDQMTKQEAVRQARMVQKSLFVDSWSLSSDPSAEDQMAVLQMLGPKSGSCPVVFKKTAFQVFSDSSLVIGASSSLLESDQYGSLHFECPKCGETNTRPKGKLISNCRHCNADVRC